MAKSKIIKGSFPSPLQREMMSQEPNEELIDAIIKLREFELKFAFGIVEDFLKRDLKEEEIEYVELKEIESDNRNNEVYFNKQLLGTITVSLFDENPDIYFTPIK